MLEGYEPEYLGLWLGRPLEETGTAGATVKVRTALLVRALYRRLVGCDDASVEGETHG